MLRVGARSLSSGVRVHAAVVDETSISLAIFVISAIFRVTVLVVSHPMVSRCHLYLIRTVQPQHYALSTTVLTMVRASFLGCHMTRHDNQRHIPSREDWMYGYGAHDAQERNTSRIIILLNIAQQAPHNICIELRQIQPWCMQDAHYIFVNALVTLISSRNASRCLIFPSLLLLSSGWLNAGALDLL